MLFKVSSVRTASLYTVISYVPIVDAILFIAYDVVYTGYSDKHKCSIAGLLCV